MKIGIDARFFGTPGKGLGRYTEKLVTGLEELDTEHEYEIFLYGESFDEYIPSNPRFTKIQVPYRWYGFGEQLLYPFFLWRRHLDLVHFPHFNVPFLYRRPFVVTIHDLILLHYPTQKASTHHAFWYRFKYFIYLRIIRSAIRRAQSVFTVSRFTRQDVVSFYPEAEAKLHVTLEGVDQFCLWQPPEQATAVLTLYWNQVGRKGEKPYVLYVGNSYPHKNLDIFLTLAKAEPGVDIVLVGKRDYFYERLWQKIQSSGITNVYLVGGVPDEHLAVFYRSAAGYVFPSLYEGFGLPPLEAMQYGIPVLVSNRGSLPEVVGEAAVVGDPDTTEDFIAKYRALLHDEALRTRCIHTGIIRTQEFSWQKMAEATKDVYNRGIKR
jgi:glycosyltransferase involved in cell wall biosynthesis